MLMLSKIVDDISKEIVDFPLPKIVDFPLPTVDFPLPKRAKAHAWMIYF
jgi:hypothetical protein